MPTITCECGKSLQYSEVDIGRAGKCSRCGARIVLAPADELPVPPETEDIDLPLLAANEVSEQADVRRSAPEIGPARPAASAATDQRTREIDVGIGPVILDLARVISALSLIGGALCLLFGLISLTAPEANLLLIYSGVSGLTGGAFMWVLLEIEDHLRALRSRSG